MFGGGGVNKTRFNSVYFLDWDTKIWTERTVPEGEPCPWERTYHTSELMYPYLVVHGGEGIADLDDLWLCDLENIKWYEVPIDKTASHPCGRRFHSSCIIGT